MFEIENNQIIIGDYICNLPDIVEGKQHIKITGTATCGLESSKGYIISLYSRSAQVRLLDRIQAGYIIDDARLNDTVYIREQLDPTSEELFWIVSKKEINIELNWVNIFYQGFMLRLCPFTGRYKIIHDV